jgi:hypothetical protein
MLTTLITPFLQMPFDILTRKFELIDQIFVVPTVSPYGLFRASGTSAHPTIRIDTASLAAPQFDQHQGETSLVDQTGLLCTDLVHQLLPDDPT